MHMLPILTPLKEKVQRRVIEITPKEVKRIISDIYRKEAAKYDVEKVASSIVLKRQKKKNPAFS